MNNSLINKPDRDFSKYPKFVKMLILVKYAKVKYHKNLSLNACRKISASFHEFFKSINHNIGDGAIASDVFNKVHLAPFVVDTDQIYLENLDVDNAQQIKDFVESYDSLIKNDNKTFVAEIVYRLIEQNQGINRQEIAPKLQEYAKNHILDYGVVKKTTQDLTVFEHAKITADTTVHLLFKKNLIKSYGRGRLNKRQWKLYTINYVVQDKPSMTDIIKKIVVKNQGIERPQIVKSVENELGKKNSPSIMTIHHTIGDMVVSKQLKSNQKSEDGTHFKNTTLFYSIDFPDDQMNTLIDDEFILSYLKEHPRSTRADIISGIKQEVFRKEYTKISRLTLGLLKSNKIKSVDPHQSNRSKSTRFELVDDNGS